jgi:hypothetical protein
MGIRQQKARKRGGMQMSRLGTELGANLYMTEDDHALGINRRVPRAVVEELEQNIMNAATGRDHFGRQL